MEPDNLYINLISKHLTKQTSAEEDRELFQWMKSNLENKKTYDEIKTTWELSGNNNVQDISLLDMDDEWQIFKSTFIGQNSENTSKRISIFKQSWIRIAASFLILVSMGTGIYILLFPGKKTIEANQAIVFQNMPDGSEIALNVNSKLSYKRDYNKTNRSVCLKGEAFFEVKPDSARPFLVEIDDFRIKVLGTSFNISQDRVKNTIVVSVVTGKVLLYQQDNITNAIELVAGESAQCEYKFKKIIKNEINDPNYLSWKTKEFTFENSELGYIIKILNRSYQANVLIISKEIEKCKITLSLKDQSLESALKVIEATLDIKVEKKGNIIEISGNGCSGE